MARYDYGRAFIVTKYSDAWGFKQIIWLGKESHERTQMITNELINESAIDLSSHIGEKFIPSVAGVIEKVWHGEITQSTVFVISNSERIRALAECLKTDPMMGPYLIKDINENPEWVKS